MIEKYQDLLVEFSDRTLEEFWRLTREETIFYIKKGQQKLQNELDFKVRLHNELIVAVMNAPFGPYLKRGDKYPYKLNQNNSKKSEITEKEKNKRWLDAGNYMMSVANDFK